ncbi:MAG TPA: hypothetical protein VNF29_07885 [Candidatus Binataceae bacterium]|nr:hypothetical protein [Candidatus Binataceae bacterium]
MPPRHAPEYPRTPLRTPLIDGARSALYGKQRGSHPRAAWMTRLMVDRSLVKPAHFPRLRLDRSNH